MTRRVKRVEPGILIKPEQCSATFECAGLGAGSVFSRPFFHAAAVEGKAGVGHAANILSGEINPNADSL